jgi:hypothetical protein
MARAIRVSHRDQWLPNYGTWTADDAAKTLTFRLENASAPALSSATCLQYVTVTAVTLVTKGITCKDAAGRDHADQRMAANEIALNVGRLLP